MWLLFMLASSVMVALSAATVHNHASPCAAKLRQMRNQTWVQHPLRPAAAVNVSRAWVSTHGYTEPHCQVDPLTEMHSYLPLECAELTILDAARCLQQQGLTRVNFIGDSVTHQLAFTLACELGLTDIGRVGEVKEGPDFSLRVLHLPVVGLELHFLWAEPKPAGTAGSLARALRSALSHGHLHETALWMVNAGLWHMLCETQTDCTDEAFKGKQADYRAQLRDLLQLLHAHANGRIIWRDTTAVHPSRMNVDVSEATRRKARCCDSNQMSRWQCVCSRCMCIYM